MLDVSLSLFEPVQVQRDHILQTVNGGCIWEGVDTYLGFEFCMGHSESFGCSKLRGTRQPYSGGQEGFPTYSIEL